MLAALVACTSGSSDSTEGSTSNSAPASPAVSTSTSAATPLEGTWRSVLRQRDLERRGFSARQIQSLQVRDGWSSREVNEIRIDGDTWVLWQGTDADAPTATGDFGRLSVIDERVRLDDRTCFLVLEFRLDVDALQMTLVRSTCDDDPTEPIPDFMYAAVLGQPFERQD
jgi:hypothetical protein